MIEAGLDLLWRATAATSIAVAMVLALRGLARRLAGAQHAYRLWLAVPLALVAMMLPRAAREAAPLAVSPRLVAVTAASTAIQPETTWPWRTLVVFAWGAGAAAFAAALWARQRRFVRALSSASAAQDSPGPAVIGAWRARVVLPPDFTQRYTTDEQALVLAHEHVHLARRDGLANLVASALLVPFWFNPLLHYATRRYRFDQELSCDAVVLQANPGSARAYANAMLKTQLDPHSLPVGCHWHDRHPLVERIAMLKVPLPDRVRRLAGVTVMFVAAVSCSGAIHAMQPAPLRAPDAVVRATRTPADLAGYRIAVVMSLDGKVVSDSELVSRLGESMSLSSDEFGFWRARLKAAPLPDDRWSVDAVIEREREGNVTDTPSLVVRAGKPASIEVGDSKHSQYRLDITIWPVDDEEMRALLAQPVTPRAQASSHRRSARAPAVAPTPRPSPTPAVAATPAASPTPAPAAAPAIAATPAASPRPPRTPAVIATPAAPPTPPPSPAIAAAPAPAPTPVAVPADAPEAPLPPPPPPPVPEAPPPAAPAPLPEAPQPPPPERPDSDVLAPLPTLDTSPTPIAPDAQLPPLAAPAALAPAALAPLQPLTPLPSYTTLPDDPQC